MFRAVRFASRLRDHGIEPIVVTIRPDQLSEMFNVPINNDLLRCLHQDTVIHQLKCVPEKNRKSRVGEFLRVWARRSDGFFSRLRASMEELLASGKVDNVDAIYVTLPPFGAGDLAIMAQDLLKKPLVVDMRDAWSQWGLTPFPTYFHYSATKNQEKRLYQRADKILTVTSQLAGMLSHLTPGCSIEKIVCLPNATDDNVVHPSIEWTSEAGSTVNIGYVGSFYFNQHTHDAQKRPWFKRPIHYWPHFYATQQDWLYRTPYYFFRSWQRLKELNEPGSTQIRFHLIGDTPDWLPRMAKEFEVLEDCTFHGRVKKQEVGLLIDSFDFLLATSIKVENGEDYCLASKTFEYVSSGKPILGFVCTGSQRDFLIDSQTGIIFDPDLIDTSAEQLQSVLANGIHLQPDLDFLQQYSAEQTTAKLADTLFSVVAERKR